MKKVIALSILLAIGAFGLACNGTSTTNTNANTPRNISPNLPLSNATPWVDNKTPTPARDMNTVSNMMTNSTNTNSRTNTNSAAANTRTNSTSPANRTNSNR